jgi:ketosteroid isomerase-like protein
VLFVPFWPPYASQSHAQRVARTPFRTVSLRRWVNKPPVDVQQPGGWHHAHGVKPVDENVGWQEGGSYTVSSEAEENKALVRRFLEERGKGNLDVIDELLSPDFVDRSLMPGQGPTREDYKRSVAEIPDAFSTTRFTIEEQFVEGDTVVTKFRESSVQRREFAGLPPTEEEETSEGIYIHRISGGKITRSGA